MRYVLALLAFLLVPLVLPAATEEIYVWPGLVVDETVTGNGSTPWRRWYGGLTAVMLRSDDWGACEATLQWSPDEDQATALDVEVPELVAATANVNFAQMQTGRAYFRLTVGSCAAGETIRYRMTAAGPQELAGAPGAKVPRPKE